MLELLRPTFEGDRDMMSVSHGTAIRTITTYATGVDGGFSGDLTNCRYIVIKSGEADFGQGDLVRWANTGSKQM